MTDQEITKESVLQRLDQMHPGWHCSVSVNIWNHGNVHVHLSVHPRLEGDTCWYLAAEVRGDDRPMQEREREGLARVLGKAERGEWEKPLPKVPALADGVAAEVETG